MVWDDDAGVLVKSEPPDGAPSSGGDFETFFLGHHADVFACFRLLARDASEAEEISQEAFLRVWQRWDRVASMERPDGYLYRTAMNVLVSRRRRAASALRRLGRWERAAQTVATEGGVGAVEDRDTVARELARLPLRQRAAFVLTEGLQLSSEEAGEAMGIAASTVRVLVARARETLQKGTGERDA